MIDKNQNEILSSIENYLTSQPYEVLKKMWNHLESSCKDSLINSILNEYKQLPENVLLEQYQNYLHRDSFHVFRGF